MIVTLSRSGEAEIVDALATAFTPEDLDYKVADPLGVPASARSAAREPRERAAALVRWAQAAQQVERLLAVALKGNPSNAALRRLNEVANLLPATTRLLDEMTEVPGVDAEAFARGLAEAQRQVCGIVLPTMRSTAFLVGVDLIMTHSNALSAADAGSLREMEVVFEGARARLHTEHPIVINTKDGVCVLRLDRPIGREVEQTNADVSVRARGWVVPGATAAPPTGPVVVVMYTPDGIRVAWDTHGFAGIEGDKLRYRTNTLGGSLGAPCFDEGWHLLGMHVGFDRPRLENYARTLAAIFSDLRSVGFGWYPSSGVHPQGHAAPEASGGELDALFHGIGSELAPSDDVWSSEVDELDLPIEDRWAWAEAAAVHATYDPATLQPTGTADETARVALLLESRQVGGRWVISDPLRRAALLRLASKGQLAHARGLNPGDPDDPVDACFGALIDGRTPHVDPRDQSALRCFLTALDWLDGVVEDLPDRAGIRAALERAMLLAPFRHLTRGFFAGRELELAKLAHYVASGSDRPLFIHAPGGMGKSALLAHFVLANADLDPTRPGEWRPFVYLDFDRPDLDATDLVGVLLAIVRQLGPQVPSIAAQAQRLVEQYSERRRQTYRPRRRANRKQQSLAAQLTPSSSYSSVLRDATPIFAALSRSTPIVLILDTLEEVQFTSPDAIEPLIALVGSLRELAPSLRPVLAGRVAAEDGVEPMELGPLPRAAAEALLSNELPPEIAKRTELVARLAEICNGNPLSLRLAAEVVEREAEDASTVVDELGRELEARVSDAIVQGRLYERVLGHIHDVNVRKLAHPGLVVRHITPELVHVVLAGPCDLLPLSEDDARALFDALANEVALVGRREGDSLELRPELRRVVLEDFLRDTNSQAQRMAIHTAAIAYYEKGSTPTDRAEEIYHRLASGEDPDRVDKRWMKGIEPLLRDAIGELPSQANAYLANRVGGVVDAEEISSATPTDWEQWVGKRASDLLKFGTPAKALELIESRAERLPTSRLHYIESIARRTLGDLPRAEPAAELAVQAARAEANSEHIRDALEELVQVRRLRGNTEGVLRALAELGNLGDVLGDDLVLLQSEVQALESFNPQSAGRERFTGNAVRVFSRLPDELVVRAPELSRRVAAQVGGADPATLQRVIRLVGTGSLDTADAVGLRAVLDEWRATDAEITSLVPDAKKSPLEVASAARYLVSTREMSTTIAQRLADWLASVVSDDVARRAE